MIFKREELQYDIDNYCYIEGSVLPEEASSHNRHMVQDVGQEGNVDRVTRVLDAEVAGIKELLYPYTKSAVVSEQLDDMLRAPEVYGIVLNIPEEFSETTLSLFEKLIHEYLVCKVMEDWMSITNPQKMQIWGIKAEAALEKLRTRVNTRRGKTTRALRPF